MRRLGAKAAWKVLAAVVAGLIVLNLFYPFVWFSTEFRARVVDESTGRPVAYAIVLANWTLVGGLVHPSELGQLAVSEVTTGTDGVFRIPAWGPRFAIGLGHLTTTEPKIRVMSPEHYPLILNNQPRPMTPDNFGRASPVIRFLYQDQNLKLTPRNPDFAAYEKQLDYLRLELSFVYNGRNCEWRAAPRTLGFMRDRKHELLRHGLGAQLSSGDELRNQAHCGG